MLTNAPELWRAQLPQPSTASHKYTRGHAVISGGPITCAGATKIAATCALRAGAGLVSVACNASALPVYAASFASVMTKLTAHEDDYRDLISDERVSALLIGPGAGVCDSTKQRVASALATTKPTVLDADALSVFAGDAIGLKALLNPACVLTPHEGEFARLFDGVIDMAQPRETRAARAAEMMGCVVVLKGAETIIAAPDGRAVINHHASPYLATAGSGDALAGIITGLLAQGMPSFEAACAAVWLHGDVGQRVGAGLIAEDIAAHLPASLQAL